ncbi:MAG: hypothetical protein WC580_10260 [Agrococcus sp.]
MTPAKGERRTVQAGEPVRRGRLAKAKQFLRVAEDAEEFDKGEGVADAAVTLYVHAGIAAADAICARALGVHARGQDHQEAIELLASVDPDAAADLRALLAMKTRAGYGHDPITPDRLARAQRAARALVSRAQD